MSYPQTAKFLGNGSFEIFSSPLPKRHVFFCLWKTKQIFYSIYNIPCSCSAIYVNETGRSIKARLREQRRWIKSGFFTHSALAEHQPETGHNILFHSTSVPFYTTHKHRETIEICEHPNNLVSGIQSWSSQSLPFLFNHLYRLHKTRHNPTPFLVRIWFSIVNIITIIVTNIRATLISP